MPNTATLKIDDKEYPLPIMVGTEGEKAVDTRALRAASGYVAYDQGYGNTGSCESQITYLDGDNGILRHRGYPIEQLAHYSDFVETAYLVIYGELPTATQRQEFGLQLRKHAVIETQMQKILEGFPTKRFSDGDALGDGGRVAGLLPQLAQNNFREGPQNLRSGRHDRDLQDPHHCRDDLPLPEGLPFMFPKQELPFCENFLHMMFSEPYQDYIRGARGSPRP